jgi:RimJ/RimL family protein N-acetyltransferase
MEQPTLTTRRLTLRPFEQADAPHVQALAGAREVADTTGNIPHPYGEGVAEQWIATHALAFAESRAATFAITRSADQALMGAIGLTLTAQHRRAEMGYWLGVPYWNQGYGTEAAAAMLGYGFGVWRVHRIVATHLTRNPASGRIMQKIGMTYEGCLRQHMLKWGVFEDLACYGILRWEWEAQRWTPEADAPDD